MFCTSLTGTEKFVFFHHQNHLLLLLSSLLFLSDGDAVKISHSLIAEQGIYLPSFEPEDLPTAPPTAAAVTLSMDIHIESGQAILLRARRVSHFYHFSVLIQKQIVGMQDFTKQVLIQKCKWKQLFFFNKNNSTCMYKNQQYNVTAEMLYQHHNNVHKSVLICCSVV